MASSAVLSASSVPSRPPPLPPPVFDSLVHYAVFSNSTGKMEEGDLREVAGVLRLRGPCHLLVFGLGHETPLWSALNHGGRTVFVDENEYYVARVENLLFSDCRLAINDLPNQLYDVAWDVILVDGPKGFSATEPGRMSAIFTAAVMARSGGPGHVDVLVHDYDRKVEKLCSAEFLCLENLVVATRSLAHFRISGGPADEFCANQTDTASLSLPAGGEAAAS
ncbi:plant-specific domain TIGR01627 family protein [Musa troglodytarum]|uniref:Plant-specific domain TIGR01627 family protein n=1 Tax=Musa troglodytarum TaxID=320322 RepID=A0A9E7KQA8_9LILI|nr:plant-specific domain TIGR01627 family protein [Musa troglodytarum]